MLLVRLHTLAMFGKTFGDILFHLLRICLCRLRKVKYLTQRQQVRIKVKRIAWTRLVQAKNLQTHNHPLFVRIRIR
jgi:hypothetical protein